MDGLVDGLNDAQLRAVTTEGAPLAILAGAGSGKTRVLTRRIAYRCANETADARHVLALTFTRRAAGQLVDRVSALGLRDRPTAGTFHAIAYAQLRSHWADRRMTPPGLLDRPARAIARLLTGKRRPGLASEVMAEIAWAKARIVGPGDYPHAALDAGRRSPLPVDAISSLYSRYEEHKRAANLVDFDDLLWKCAVALESDETFGAAQRWRFRHVFVDEFQDVNPLQFRLLQAWLGSSTDLCVVGDPNQAIYSWNGADAGYLRNFERHFPGSEVVVLDENHRSTPQILAVANATLAGQGFRLRPTRADGPAPTVRIHASDGHEAAAIARLVLDRHGPGVPWQHQAVLARTHAQAALLETALKRVGIPCAARGREPFLERPEVADALKALERDRSGFLEAVARLDAVIEVEDDMERSANLAALVTLAGDFLAEGKTPSGTGFTAWLKATLGDDDLKAGADVVDIATFHAAKGLEWPIVHVAGLEDGLVPIVHARTAEAFDEERRLLHVALTRAERELHLNWAQLRVFGTHARQRQPSPFLEDLQPVLDTLVELTASADWREHLPAARAAARARRRAEPDEQSELVAALTAWRARAARAADVAPTAILDDSALRELATTRPRDKTSLRAVPGIGAVRADQFGDQLLAVLAGGND